MDNKITQRYELDTSKNTLNIDIIASTKDSMDLHILEIINRKYPINKVKEGNYTKLNRQIFVFNKEELDEFIKEIKNKKHDYEV